MPTKTVRPLRLEDLEPRRFEDLVRNLIYDFRDWKALEPITGEEADDGYSARGWERSYGGPTETVVDDCVDDVESQPIPEPEGRLWMIQCKRDGELGPSDIGKIVKQAIDPNDPPYGFLLAAPANLSPKSYEAFQTQLAKRGVMEFYLWGNAEIENMLHMPKNDRVMFAFMGVSLASRARSRAAEMRAAVSTKNRLIRTLSGGVYKDDLFSSILVRDINDDAYPEMEEVPDFESRPRWKEHIVTQYHPQGLLVLAKKHYAYVDEVAKEYDLVESLDLVFRQSDDEEERQNNWERMQRIEDFHKDLPLRNQAIYKYYGLIRFQDILLVDDKGDMDYGFPHVFIDLQRGHDVDEHFGPFNGFAVNLELDGNQFIDLKSHEYKRKPFFPTEFPE